MAQRTSGEEQHLPVHRDGVSRGHVARLQRVDPIHRREGERDSERPSQEGEGQALDQELAGDAGAAGPEGGPHRDLLLAGERPGQKEVGHVRARDEEDECHGAREHQEGEAHVAHHLLEKGHDAEGEPSVRRVHVGVVAAQASGDRVHLRLRLGQGHTGKSLPTTL